jgi:hypothetical protein
MLSFDEHSNFQILATARYKRHAPTVSQSVRGAVGVMMDRARDSVNAKTEVFRVRYNTTTLKIRVRVQGGISPIVQVSNRGIIWCLYLNFVHHHSLPM